MENKYQYYYHRGMLYRVGGDKVFALVQGKGWVEWKLTENLEKDYWIDQGEAAFLAEQLGESL